MLAAAMLLGAAAQVQGAGPTGKLNDLPPVKICNDGATVHAQDRCPPPLHSSILDPGLRPELAIVLDCRAPPSPASEESIEKALYRSGFDTLNRRRLAGGTANYPVIEAIRDDRVVRVTSAPTAWKPGMPARLFVNIYSRPQQRPDRRLERRLTSLAAGIEPRSCRVAKTERATNAPSSITTFERVAWITKAHMSEVLKRAPDSSAYRAHSPRR